MGYHLIVMVLLLNPMKVYSTLLTGRELEPQHQMQLGFILRILLVGESNHFE